MGAQQSRRIINVRTCFQSRRGMSPAQIPDGALDKPGIPPIVTRRKTNPKSPMRSLTSLRKRPGGFSLIELLVVVVIIALISIFAVPAAGRLLQGSSMTRATNLLNDELARARQHALTRNRAVEVRFYAFVDPERPVAAGSTDPSDLAQFRGLQYFEIPEQTIGGKSVPLPVGKPILIPESIILSSNATLSSLLSGTQNQASAANFDVELPRGVGLNYKFLAFRYLPDGATNLSASTVWFLTIHRLEDMKSGKMGAAFDQPPPNFVTMILNPVSGAVKALRPGS